MMTGIAGTNWNWINQIIGRWLLVVGHWSLAGGLRCVGRAVVLLCVLNVASPTHAQSVRDTIGLTQPKIVKIFGAGGRTNLAAYGTGFFVSPQGHIATVWSHVLDADVVGVVLADGRRFTAKVLGAEPQLALAVLKLNAAEGLEFPYFAVTEATSAGMGSSGRIR